MKPYDNVLVVDDEPHAVRVLSMILKQEGYRVLESTTVDRAIDIIRNNDVHAVITDIKMPEKDGFTLFEYVSDHVPDMPVLFLTAYGTVESAVAMMKSGACHYFVKPPDYPELKAVLRQAIEQHGAKKIPALHKKPVKPLKIMESQAIADALMQCNGNKSKAARQLGISRKKFYKRLAEFAER